MSMAAQKQNQAYLDYIEKWKETAVANQEDYGIPASIIMAQALLESGAGQSELALKARNHFGIKCTSDWFGGVYYYDDERNGECFRQYNNAAQSFRDHALFLQRPRYSTCFEIAVEDYEGWAHRLKECGYATDKNYAPKLIKLIEDYRLDTLYQGERSKVKSERAKVKGERAKAEPAERTKTDNDGAGKQPGPQGKKPLKAEVVHRSEPIMVIHNDPEPEYVKPLTAKEERDSFFLMHPKKKINGVPYVVAREGDTYANVAFRLNVRERDLRMDNDALGRELHVGDLIFLSAKKTTGAKPYVWTHVGQSLWELCQAEGVQMEYVQKLNELDPSIRVFRTKQRIYLQKVKD